MSLQQSIIELQNTRQLAKLGDMPMSAVLTAWKSVAKEFATNTESAAKGLVAIAADLCAEYPDIADEIFAEALRPLYALGIDGWEGVTRFIGQQTPSGLFSFLPQPVSRRGANFLRQLVTDRKKLTSSMQIMYDLEKVEWASGDLGEPPIPSLLENDENAA